METLEQLPIRSAEIPTIREIQIPSARRRSPLQAGYGLAIFLGAFLLFQVQLIVAKYLLPWFGGSAAVWTTCMLFFEVLLVGGYAYAHLLGSRFSEQRQSRIHIVVLLVSLCVMIVLASRWPSPITPGTSWKPNPRGNPAWQLARLLALTIGIPFFVLSSTGPLMQRWFSRSFGQQSTYRLYSLSNIGSLLALISYPSLFERFLHIDQQAWTWSIAFTVFLVTLAFVAFYRLKTTSAAAATDEHISPIPESLADTAKPGFLRRFQWISFAACASAMLLATTNLMCQEVAVIPLLWVLPLSL